MVSIEEDIQKIAKTLKDIEEVSFAILFGSLSRGEQHKFSDIDVAVYITKDVSIRTLLDALLILSRPIDLKILNDAPPLFRLRVLKEGEVLFIKDDELYERFVYETLVEALDFKETYYRILKEVSEAISNGVQ